MAMSRLCLDTSAYSRFKRGDPETVALIDQADWIGVPAVVLGELWAGFLLGRQRRANEAELEAFLSNPVVEEVPVDAGVARLYAEILAALRKAGTPIPTNDIWVAATAARVGATVLTADRHFEAVKRIGSLVLGSSADAQD
jgi:tRNA(fMet)-specific endonuclease VapC